MVSLTLATLRDNLVFNRSALPPFRLPPLAAELVDGLFAYARTRAAEGAQSLGEGLGGQGLGLRAFLAVGRAWAEHACRAEGSAGSIERAAIPVIQDYASFLAAGIAACELQEMVRQRDELQTSLARVMQAREEALRQALDALSTPVMPVFDGVLVLPLIGTIERERAETITERLLNAVVAMRARIIIIDVTGVDAVDVAVAEALLRLTSAVSLLGSRAVLAGIRAELAATLVRIGVDLSGMASCATLQSAIEWALAERGLSIQPLATARLSPAAAAAPRSLKR